METNKNQQLNSVRLRQPKIKDAVIKQLARTPIVQVACERASISRATFYRWRTEDEKFRKATDEAIAEGETFINDMSESQLISLIKEKNWAAISFWLRHHHPKYAQRIEISANINQPQEELNPEQEAVVREALRLALPTAPEEKIVEDNKIINNQNTQNYEQPKQQSTEQQTFGQKPTESNRSNKSNEPAEKSK